MLTCIQLMIQAKSKPYKRKSQTNKAYQDGIDSLALENVATLKYKASSSPLVWWPLHVGAGSGGGWSSNINYVEKRLDGNIKKNHWIIPF